MAETTFENLQTLLKAHPEARHIAHPRRATTKSPGPAGSFTRPPALDRHRRKCKICRHPDRSEIERDFLRWRSSTAIAKDFGIYDHSSICRHARATDLRDRRQRTVAYALHPILEQAEDIFVKPTPSAIISAVRTYSQINDEGRRLRSKPLTKIFYVTEAKSTGVDVPRHSPALSGLEGPLATRHRLSNRPIQELEDDSTH